jgi:hypothetical protein
MFKKNSFVWMMALLILLLAPFVLLTFFVWPSSDDYAMSYMLSNGNDTIWGLLRVLYMEWGGRYSAWLGTLLSPVVVNHLWVYRGVLVLTFALLLLALRFFWAGVVIAHGGRGTSLAWAGVFLLLWMHLVPGIAESFFWYSGVVVYIWPWILLLAVGGLLCIRKVGTGAKALVSVGLFFLIGFNEMAAMLGLLMALMYVAMGRDEGKYFPRFWILLPVIMGLLLLLLSPGNARRMALFANGGNLYDAITITLVSLSKLNGIHLQCISLWLIGLILFPRLDKVIFHPKLKFFIRWHPAWVFLSGQLVMFALLFVPAWSMGINPPLRVYGFLSPLWLMWFFWLLASVRNHTAIALAERWPRFGGVGLRVMVGIVALSLMTTFIKVPGGPLVFGGNVPQAWYDLAFRAQSYNRELHLREKFIQEAHAINVKQIAVPALSDPPPSIFFMDMTTNPDHWINPLYARHYGLERVWVKPLCE